MESKHKSIRAFVKIYVKNAFNEIRRDALLEEVKKNIPEIFKFVEQCYRNPTNVYYGEHLILSQRGVPWPSFVLLDDTENNYITSVNEFRFESVVP